MILVRCYNPSLISTYLNEAGIAPERVQFNGAESKDISVILQVGGQGVDYTHCYVQQHYSIPVITCLDPATLWRSPENKVFVLCALSKALSIDSGLRSPTKVSESQVLIPTTLQEIKDFFIWSRTLPYVAIDIECHVDSKELTCIGFGSADRALTIPLQHEETHYWSPSDELEVWCLIAEELATPQRKLIQNFIFEVMILSRLGLAINGPLEDTMTLAHTFQPELPKGLKDLARLYLYVAPWKGSSDWRSNYNLWFYNAQDVIYTAQIYEALREALDDTCIDPRLALYDSQLVPLHSEVAKICQRGLKVDKEALQKLTRDTEDRVAKLTAELLSMTEGLIPPKISYIQRKGSLKGKRDRDYYTLSNGLYEKISIPEDVKMLKAMPIPIYEKLITAEPFNPASPEQVKEVIRALGHKIPTRRDPKTKEMVETANELSLLKLNAKHKHPFYRALLEHREQNKILTTYCAIQLDSDDRLRFKITVPGTVTSRFSSQKTDWDTGANVQNVPKNFRKMIIPDHSDYVILNVDLKQADPHVVAWLSGEEDMLRIMDSGGDLHAHTGSAIAGHDITAQPNYDKDTSIDRKLGKAANNGLNYGMQASRFADMVFQQTGIALTQAKAELIHAAYFKLYPRLRAWQNNIEATINKTRVLTTPFGRVRYFYDRLSPKIYQDAMAYIPPTTVSDALNAGWLAFSKVCYELRVDVLQQCHDSLMLQCHREDLDLVASLLIECIEGITFEINGKIRHFEADASYGDNWGELRAWNAKRS